MDDEKLINLIQQHAFIYNKKLGDFRNKEKKATAWRSIAQEMNRSEEQCIRRWTSLRDKFSKVCREQDQPSGSGTSEENGWHFFDNMSFLKEHVKPRITRTNASITSSISRSSSPQPTQIAPIDWEVFIEEEATQQPLPAASSTPNKRKRSSDDIDRCVMSALGAFEKKCKDATPRNNAIEGFKMMIGSMVKTFPPHKQSRVMKKVLDVITEEQEEDL